MDNPTRTSLAYDLTRALRKTPAGLLRDLHKRDQAEVAADAIAKLLIEHLETAGWTIKREAGAKRGHNTP